MSTLTLTYRRRVDALEKLVKALHDEIVELQNKPPVVEQHTHYHTSPAPANPSPFVQPSIQPQWPGWPQPYFGDMPDTCGTGSVQCINGSVLTEAHKRGCDAATSFLKSEGVIS